MDYEKLYKEALERAKKVHDEHRAQPFDVMLKVFPELKESEDERIRKELINYFIKGKEYLSLCSFSKEEILAWLEKQGEQLMKVPRKVQATGLLKQFIDEQKFLTMKEAGYERDAEKKELKKIDEIEELFKNSDVEVDSNEDGLIAATINKNEQEPAWSEEDEEMLNLIIARLHSHPNVDLDEYSKEYNWLNSVKPQNRWKPSDEQIKQLGNCIGRAWYNGDELVGLYNDLKKLKGE